MGNTSGGMYQLRSLGGVNPFGGIDLGRQSQPGRIIGLGEKSDHQHLFLPEPPGAGVPQGRNLQPGFFVYFPYGGSLGSFAGRDISAHKVHVNR